MKKYNSIIKEINISIFLPLNSENSIHRLLDSIEKKHLILGDKEIGFVLQYIKKIKLQLLFKEHIVIINVKSKEFLKNQKQNKKHTSSSNSSKKTTYAKRSVWVIYTPMGGMNRYR